MKCKDCKYYDKNGPQFENTTLKTYKCAYYLITQLKKVYEKDGKSHAYTTTALTGENDRCMFRDVLLTYDD